MNLPFDLQRVFGSPSCRILRLKKGEGRGGEGEGEGRGGGGNNQYIILCGIIVLILW